MDFLKYDIKDSGAFAPFISTMEDAGADIEGPKVMFESGNSAAKMLADTLVEYDIIAPMMEAGQDANSEPGESTDVQHNVERTEVQSAGQNTAVKDTQSGAEERKTPPGARLVIKKDPNRVKIGKRIDDFLKELGVDEKSSARIRAAAFERINTEARKFKSRREAAAVYVKYANNDNEVTNKLVFTFVKERALHAIRVKLVELGLDKRETSYIAEAVLKKVMHEHNREELVNLPNDLTPFRHLFFDAMQDVSPEFKKNIFAKIQKNDPEFYEELKETGKLNDKGENTVSLAQKTELSKAISQLVGQIEVPDAFNVEIDDSEWENAVITAFGFPMINLTSPLVREMLRAQDPKQQKRAYKEFKKQLKSDPDVAKALGVGVMGTLGIGGNDDGAKTDKKTRIDTRTESVSGNGAVLVEGPIGDIRNALKTPVDVLKSIAQSKGTPCHRNNLVVMYDDIDGKSGDSQEGVKVTPLGVSGGVLVDKNLSVTVPMSHLSAFYSVVDPKASFKSYAKAMAEVNAKSDNANKGLGDAAAAAGKKLLSKIPLLGRGAKQELATQEADSATKAMGELAMYIKENGHPPFYLLKPKTEPKEIDKWSDEDAANGYQMITMLLDGRKAGMIMKESTANALFKVG